MKKTNAYLITYYDNIKSDDQKEAVIIAKSQFEAFRKFELEHIKTSIVADDARQIFVYK